MKEIKQNKNSSVIRFFSFVTALVVLVFSISVPSFATSNNGVDFSFEPIQYNPSTSTPFEDLTFTVCTDSDGYSLKSFSTDNENVFLAYLQGSASNSSYAWISEEPFTARWVSYYSSSNSYDWGEVSSSAHTYDSDAESPYYGRSYYSVGSFNVTGGGRVMNQNATAYVPVYNVGNVAFVTDFFAYIDNLSPSAGHSFSGSLPAGNAIILDVSGNNAEPLSLSTSSALRHKDNWSDGNQMMGYFASAPTSLNSPFVGTHSITWRGTGSPNLFGGYNTWNTTAPLLPTGNYLVIVNPAYPNDNPDSITSNQASNGSISITCGFVRSATVVPLSSSWDNGSIVSSSGNIRLDGEYDSETDSWSFVNSSTGQPQNPVSGGLTDVDAEHITINDWLQNISHQIGSFFSGAIGAVSTLVSAGSDFIHSLSGLYAWLPAPVYSVLVSALILVITIGVIKVFI